MEKVLDAESITIKEYTFSLLLLQ